jgi:lipopolysaccharide transport system permease protein
MTAANVATPPSRPAPASSPIANMGYIRRIWGIRHFWLHLALADLRTKYRRSRLGMLWSILQPLGMTLLLAVVLGRVFHTAMADYAPYVFSGLVVWEFIVTAAVTGCTAFINAEGYIRQFPHPLAIYPLRYTIAGAINLGTALFGLIAWVLVTRPAVFGFTWISLVPAMALVIWVAWPVAVVSAFLNARFRDFSQLVVLIMQALWYVSPVFFEPKVFRDAKLDFLVDLNPVYHLLELFRAPLLRGEVAQLESFLFVTVTGIALWIVAGVMIARNEARLIFYL